MDDSDIPYTERDLIQRAITSACLQHELDWLDGRAIVKPRWGVIKHLFGTGSAASEAICRRYGFDPERLIGGVENG